MPRHLTFQHGKSAVDLELRKVDRSQLYGSVRVLTRNADDEPCTLATLASDGKTLIPRGGTALGYINTEGRWIARNELQAISMSGEPLSEVPSSFDQPVVLKKTVQPSVLLDHSVRLTYLLGTLQDLPAALSSALKKGKLFQFGFSYRGGIDHDPAFLMADGEENVWMLVTTANEIDYLSLEQAALCGTRTEQDDIDGDDDEDNALDFGML